MAGDRPDRVALRLSGLLASTRSSAIPFEKNSDGFDFDTQIILQLIEAGAAASRRSRSRRTTATRSATSTASSTRGRLAARRYGTARTRWASAAVRLAFASGPTNCKPTPGYVARADAQLALDHRPPADPGSRVRRRCAGTPNSFARPPRDRCRSGSVSTGCAERLDAFVQADLEHGIPDEVGAGYDVVLCADVIEHVRDPRHCSHDAGRLVSAGGSVIACVPNFGHWYPRTRVAIGCSTTTAAASSTRPTSDSSRGEASST